MTEELKQTPTEDSGYNASSIQILEGLEAVRKRPVCTLGTLTTVQGCISLSTKL